jgi:hypothetical protein
VPVSGTDGTVAPLILTWRRSVKPKPLMADRLILSMTSPFEATTVKKFWPFPRLNVPVNVSGLAIASLPTTVIVASPGEPMVPPMDGLKMASVMAKLKLMSVTGTWLLLLVASIRVDRWRARSAPAWK